MPLDPSIFQNVVPKPLELGSVIDMARAKQRLDAESSIGGIMGQATNPDGSIDPGKLGQLAPRAGVMAPEIALRAQQFQQNQNTIDHGKFDNYRLGLGVFDDKLSTLRNKVDLSHEDVLGAIHSLIGHPNLPHLTSDMAVDIASQTYNRDGTKKNAYQLRQMLGQFHNQVAGSLEASKPVETWIDPVTGQRRTITQSGAIAADADVPRSPQEAQQRARDLRDIARRTGGAPGAPGAPDAVQPGIPGAAIAPGGGVTYPTTMPGGYAQAAAGVGTQSAASANHLSEANDTSMVRKAMLGNLEDDLEKFTSGPGADWTKFAKAWINRNVPKPQGWEFDPHSIASQEAFNKQAAMLAQQQFAAIGGTGTDAKFESAFTTSPNEALSKLGNKGIIRLLKGNEDAIQAKNEAWQVWQEKGHGPETFAQFSREFNKHFDPRVFQFKYIPRGEQQAYINKMEPDERPKLKANIEYARAQGWIRF